VNATWIRVEMTLDIDKELGRSVPLDMARPLLLVARA
jgi:hypothetical protein